MKCPLFVIAWAITRPGEKGWKENCLKEDCAWWSDEMEQCDPTGLIPWLRQVKEAIQDVRDQMPVARE